MSLFPANFAIGLFAFSPASKANEARSDHLRLSSIKNCPRKINKIKNWMYGARPNFKFSFKKISISGKWSGGRRALTPYYSSSWGGLPSCSTNHFYLINVFQWFLFKIGLKNWKNSNFRNFRKCHFFRPILKLLCPHFHLL